MVHTVWEALGTGAGTIRHSTLWTSRHGGIADGMTDGITEAGTVLIIMEDSMEDGTTHGIGAVIGDGTIRGTVRIIADGTEAGTLTGGITTITDMVRDTSEMQTIIKMYGTDQDIGPALKEYSETDLLSEEV